MAVRAPRRGRAARPEREPLSRERVLETAVALADAEGIDGLSMRRLGTELGVEAMSLYHYFRNKDQLLSAMLDVVYREIEVPPVEGDWRAPMRQMAITWHAALLRHRWACGLLMATMELTEPRKRHMDSVLARLREGGLSDVLIDHAYHALDSYIVGFTLWQLPILNVIEKLPELAGEVRAELADGRYPDLLSHMDYHLAPRSESENAFEFGLGLILDGLERMRVAA